MTKKIAKSEIRKDYFLNKYVIISPNRSNRPKDTKEDILVNKSISCPFCPTKIDKNNITDFIGKKDDWDVLSIKNIYSAVTIDNKHAFGHQDVIIESQKHELEMADFSKTKITNILKMFVRRTTELSKIQKINYILCFKNQGSKAGASITHPHSQVFASEILPPLIQEELDFAQSYKTSRASCVYCDIIKKELRGPRKIWSDKNVAVFAPYASEYHYEAWIFTKRHIDNITYTSNNELDSIANALKIVLAKLRSLDLAFNLYMHQVIKNTDQHFYIKIQPRDSIWAGIELGSGLIINSVSPEQAAMYYKQ